MEWTFDPLEIKNAYLNIHKLGVIACRYEEDFYGVSSSRLQGGLPTDRLVAEWRLDSPRVEAILQGARQLHVLSRKKLRNGFQFRPPSMNGRPRKLTGNELCPSNWRTGAGFNRHFPRDWP